MARTYHLVSLRADDILVDNVSIAGAREEIATLRKQPDMHRYFPLTIEFDAPRSPYFRRLRVHSLHRLDGTSITFPRGQEPYVRASGETELPGYPTSLELPAPDPEPTPDPTPAIPTRLDPMPDETKLTDSELAALRASYSALSSEIGQQIGSLIFTKTGRRKGRLSAQDEDTVKRLEAQKRVLSGRLNTLQHEASYRRVVAEETADTPAPAPQPTPARIVVRVEHGTSTHDIPRDTFGAWASFQREYARLDARPELTLVTGDTSRASWICERHREDGYTCVLLSIMSA